MYSSRLERLRQTLKKQGLTGLIVTKRENLHFLTGLVQVHPVNREALLFISPKEVILYHSSFLTPPSLSFLRSIPMSSENTLESVLTSAFTAIKPPRPSVALREGGSSIGFEAHNITYAEYRRFEQILSPTPLSPTQDLLEQQRLLKDAAEVKNIQKACTITQKTMSWLLDPGSVLRLRRDPGSDLTEIALSRLIEQKLYELGADSLAFPVIVAFNENSALPHHLPGKTTLKPDSVVLLDFGCMVNGYASDMTRTICLGIPSTDFLNIEKSVLASYQAGLNLLKSHFSVSELTDTRSRISRTLDPGSKLTAAALDEAVRNVIKADGFGDQFIHTSGHGLGLEIHEQPSISSQNAMELQPNMVITLEPGIYLPHRFGYRHENTLFLKDHGQ